MIAKRLLGANVNGLLAYLWGPGKRDEHADPHLVASWDGTYVGDDAALPALEPKQLGSGQYSIGALGSLLRQPVDADQFAPAKWVYHVPVRAHPDDPILTDEQWADVAREVMSSVGLASVEDPSGCRWVAMKHGPDHIHIVATLSRQDGARADLHNDFYKMRAACHRVEERYRLVSTAPADVTADVASSSRETSEAIRVGGVGAGTKGARADRADRAERVMTVRDILRQRVQQAAAGSAHLEEFRSVLAASGVDVHLRMSTQNNHVTDEVTGISFSLAGGKTDRAGQVIKFSGSKLAPDLSWRKLAARWDRSETTVGEDAGGAGGDASSRGDEQTGRREWAPDEESVWAEAERIMHEAADRIRAEGMTDPDGAGDAAWAAADTARSAAYLLEGDGGGPVTDAADAMARAGRESYGRIPHRSDTGAGLRVAARMMAHAARVAGATNASPTARSQAQLAALVSALTALSRAVADLRQAQQRGHQAHVARQVATHLAGVAPAAHAAPAGGSPTTGQPEPAPRTGSGRWRTSAYDDVKKKNGGAAADEPRDPSRGRGKAPTRGPTPGRSP